MKQTQVAVPHSCCVHSSVSTQRRQPGRTDASQQPDQDEHQHVRRRSSSKSARWLCGPQSADPAADRERITRSTPTPPNHPTSCFSAEDRSNTPYKDFNVLKWSLLSPSEDMGKNPLLVWWSGDLNKKKMCFDESSALKMYVTSRICSAYVTEALLTELNWNWF